MSPPPETTTPLPTAHARLPALQFRRSSGAGAVLARSWCPQGRPGARLHAAFGFSWREPTARGLPPEGGGGCAGASIPRVVEINPFRHKRKGGREGHCVGRLRFHALVLFPPPLQTEICAHEWASWVPYRQRLFGRRPPSSSSDTVTAGPTSRARRWTGAAHTHGGTEEGRMGAEATPTFQSFHLSEGRADLALTSAAGARALLLWHPVG